MLNTYPLWKYLLILCIVLVGCFYAAPNLYPPNPAVQISGENSSINIDQQTLSIATNALQRAGIEYFGDRIADNGASALIRFHHSDQQLPARKVIQRALGDEYIVALNLAPTTPQWMTRWGGQPMKLGLDLSGGVHFLLAVDTQAAIEQRLLSIDTRIKRLLREENIRGLIRLPGDDTIQGQFNNAELRNRARSVIRRDFPELQRVDTSDDDHYYLTLTLQPSVIKEIEDYAVSQNLTTLRNRVNELGVAEPLVQRQGRNRIVVELPGIQDTAEAKRIIGKTANLEFRLEARANDPASEKESFPFSDEVDYGSARAVLEREVLITGDHVVNAAAGFSPETGRPEVNITLDSEGGAIMHRTTRHNVGRRLGVLFIERKARTVDFETNEQGEAIPVRVPYDEKSVISLATINSALGVQFRITGIESPAAAAELALLLRAGALSAPIDFVEERTIGPSLGAENIRLGLISVQIGLALVALFMVVYYRVFGLLAIVGLAVNLVLLVALMSILSATLTLPGIAGIVLTIGMAVDANVLIFGRIREELRKHMPVQQAINAGYERAFVTIMDANITTLLVAVILYAVGDGPVRGFAVTLSLGIVCSLFSAIMFTRALVNLLYGGRTVKRLLI